MLTEHRHEHAHADDEHGEDREHARVGDPSGHERTARRAVADQGPADPRAPSGRQQLLDALDHSETTGVEEVTDAAGASLSAEASEAREPPKAKAATTSQTPSEAGYPLQVWRECRLRWR